VQALGCTAGVVDFEATRSFQQTAETLEG